MAICPDCGLDHHPEVIEAVAEVEAAEVLAEGAEGAAHEEGKADVEVAKVEADRGASPGAGGSRAGRG